MNSPWLLYKNALLFSCTLMILHLSRMRRNVNRKCYDDRKNVSATACVKYLHILTCVCGNVCIHEYICTHMHMCTRTTILKHRGRAGKEDPLSADRPSLES